MVTGTGKLEKAFLESPVIDKKGYPYFVNPVSDGIPLVEPELLSEITDRLLENAKLDCDLILAPEAMGIHLATAVSMRTGVPFAVIRKKQYGLPGEITLDQQTGYSKSPMYINGVTEGMRVALIDDVISTGGTMRAITRALKEHGVTVSEIDVVYNKCKDLPALEEEMGVKVNYIIKVGVRGDKPVIIA